MKAKKTARRTLTEVLAFLAVIAASGLFNHIVDGL